MKDLKEYSIARFMKLSYELRSFIQAQSSGLNINNHQRLFSLLKELPRAATYYRKNRIRSNYVQFGSKVYKIDFEFQGNRKSIEFDEVVQPVSVWIFKKFTPSVRTEDLTQLITILSELISDNRIHIEIRIQLIDAVGEVFTRHWLSILRNLPPAVAEKMLRSHKKLLFDAIASNEVMAASPRFPVERDALIAAYRSWIDFAFKEKLARNNFAGAMSVLRNEIRTAKNTDSLGSDAARLVTLHAAYRLIELNNLLILVDNNSLSESLLSLDLLTDNDRRKLQQAIAFDPRAFDVKNLVIQPVTDELSSHPSGEIETVLYAAIRVTNQVNDTIDLENNRVLTVRSIENLFDDPAFAYSDSVNLNLSGAPISIVSDAIGALEEYCCFSLSLKGRHQANPRQVKTNVGSAECPSAEEASEADFYKRSLIDSISEAAQAGRLPLQLVDFEKGLDLFSNILVVYFAKNGKQLSEKFFALTSVDSFARTRNRFINALSALKNKAEEHKVRDLILDSKLESTSDVKRFCVNLIESTLKRSIEAGDLWKEFWHLTDDQFIPKHEPHSQPLVYHMLRHLCEVRGIFLAREVAAAGGSLDFLFSVCDQSGRMVQVCMELKNAHHKSIGNGVSFQLPAYMKDLGSKSGIFLILWYRCQIFNEPRKYESPSELEAEIAQSSIDNKLQIETIVIDCGRRASPSKLA